MSKSHTPNSALAGVILAGGQAKRLHGRDKAFLSVGGTFLLDRCIVRLKGQIDRIVISGNGDPCRFEASGLPVMGDLFGSFPGPLAGIYTAMRWCEANAPEAQAILSVAVDTPFFPINLADKLSTASGRMCEKIVLIPLIRRRSAHIRTLACCSCR
ncbi:NTP transferase domain-containing protein [uncultured Cohaesibacter sp.]|uniref:NTP transferase domain-containing protein n=1 Tax=uncultured Cohaesibacter sp. TaxID=1002546 RepID=UPI0029305248|nr:NTP transferase domain-containing protein [uncultured Cohaesibacter sp.]